MKVVRFIDLFCGIGGFRLAAQNVCSERDMKAVCVFSSDMYNIPQKLDMGIR